MSRELVGYEPIQLPNHIDYEGWTRKEAKEFFEWFVEKVDDRIAELHRLMRRLGIECSLDFTPSSLICVGAFLKSHTYTRLRSPEELAERRDRLRELPPGATEVVEAFAGDWALDDTTLALCVDIGMYFGEVLRRAYPALRWDLWTRKSVEHNKPVILGFPSGIPLDPVHVTVTVAQGFATREHEETALLDLFDYWSE